MLGGVTHRRRAPARRALRRRRGRARGRRRAARARPACPTSARCSPPPTSSTATPTRWSCSPTSSERVAQHGWWIENVDVVDRGGDAAARAARRGDGGEPRRRAGAAARADGARDRGRRCGPSAARGSARSAGPKGSRSGPSRSCRAAESAPDRSAASAGSPISLAGCCGSTTPRHARRSTSCRASTDACRCTSAARRRTTCPHLGHGRKEIVFDTIRRYLALARLRGHVREQRHRHRGQDHRPGAAKRARPNPSSSRSTKATFRHAVRPPEHPAARRGAARDRVDRAR